MGGWGGGEMEEGDLEGGWGRLRPGCKIDELRKVNKFKSPANSLSLELGSCCIQGRIVDFSSAHVVMDAGVKSKYPRLQALYWSYQRPRE